MRPDYIIASDASLKKVGKSDNYVSYAAVIMNCETNKYITISGSLSMDKTIVYAEGYAVYQGLRYLNSILPNDRKFNVLVISDSKLTVMALTQWRFHNWDTRDWFNWKKSDGKPVENQSLYRRIVHMMDDFNMNVRFAHINGHSLKNKNKQNEIYDKLRRRGINLSRITMMELLKMNDMADTEAQRISQAMVNSREEVWMKLKKRKEG